MCRIVVNLGTCISSTDPLRAASLSSESSQAIPHTGSLAEMDSIVSLEVLSNVETDDLLHTNNQDSPEPTVD